DQAEVGGGYREAEGDECGLPADEERGGGGADDGEAAVEVAGADVREQGEGGDRPADADGEEADGLPLMVGAGGVERQREQDDQEQRGTAAAEFAQACCGDGEWHQWSSGFWSSSTWSTLSRSWSRWVTT